jgi:hypothetical protein
MKSTPFYFEMKDVMTQFIAAFNDIVINRYNKDKSVKNRLKIRYVYSPKQRVVYDLVNKARHLTLPAVAVSITGVARDESRVFNKIEGAYFSKEETNPKYPRTENSLKTYHMAQPVPVNIDVSMSILARYQTDIEQIISNFVPYNDPYIVLSWKLPEQFAPTDQEIRSEVTWNGGLTMDYPDQITGSEPYRISCDTTFTIKTWLFKQHEDPIDNIYKITTHMTPVSNIDPDLSYTLPFYDDVTERSYREGLGPTLSAAPFITHVDTDSAQYEILGYNFMSTSGVYLSGNTINTLSGETVYNTLSGLYPSFTGVPIEYSITNDNKIKFDIPDSISTNETLDLIIRGPGGFDTALNSTLHGKGILLL